MPDPNEQFVERPEKEPGDGPIIVPRETWEKLKELNTEASYDAVAISTAISHLKLAVMLNTSMPLELKSKYLQLIEGLSVVWNGLCLKMVAMLDVMIETEEGLEID
jgi:hypothetical protein